MKIKTLLAIFLILILLLGCATSPKKERATSPSPKVEATKTQPPPEEKLKEILVPQMEEVKKVPDKLFSIYARDSNIHDVLLAFSKESELNIVIDPELSGKVTVDLKRVTLKEALSAILSSLGWTYSIDEKFIKISRLKMETRLFTWGVQTSSLPGQQTALSYGGVRTGYTDLISVDEMDLWKEIQKGLETLIFGSVEEKGKEAPSETEKTAWTRTDEKGRKLIINKSTGVILVTDYPLNLNKIASYLEIMEGSSQRQVTIRAKIVEVILADEYKAGINWKVIEGLPRSINFAWGLTNKAGTTGYPGGTGGYTIGDASAGTTISTPGLFKIKPFGGILAMGAAGSEIALSEIIQAISEQGEVRILSSPTISTLNNQKAIIRVGNQDVYFITGAVATGDTVTQIVQPMTIDIGIILDVTPQIAEDGTIIMNIHPSITDKTGEKTTPDGKSTFPLLSVRETDTTVRVMDGQTVIIAGLMQEKNEAGHIGVPGLKSLPLFGGLFRHKSEKKRNAELVIMITPILEVGKKVEDFVKK